VLRTKPTIQNSSYDEKLPIRLLHAHVLSRDSMSTFSASSGGSFHPVAVHSAELLIDCDEDRTLRAVLVGMLLEGDH